MLLGHVKCVECCETGFVFTKTEGMPAPMLMLCTCSFQEQAKLNAPNTPVYGSEGTTAFTKNVFPAKMFVPDESKPGHTMTDVTNRWITKIKTCDQYWMLHFTTKGVHRNSAVGLKHVI